MKLVTTKGDIVVQVKREWAPRGADHFFELVYTGYYDGVKFHRVLREFVAQFGINGKPKISELYGQLRIPDDPVIQKNRKGWLAFAKSGPNTRTTEVFINLRDNPELDKTGFAPFGQVVEGLEVAAEISGWYGELAPRGNGPESAKIYQIGNSYLDRSFPKLDAVREATILP